MSAITASRRVARRVRHELRYTGTRVECPICRGKARMYAPHRGRANARCVHCGSLERHRGLWLWLQNEIPAGSRILHVAPEWGLARSLQRLPGVVYDSVDLDSPIALRHADLTQLPDTDDSHDVILCNHVLEHIPDDRAAMRELRRVLAPGGFAVLQHPIRDRDETYEDFTITTPEGRLEHFQQEDHVRIYGRDFLDRVHEAGFEDVKLRRIEDVIRVQDYVRYGIWPTMTVIAR